jgi:hypothetical protein
MGAIASSEENLTDNEIAIYEEIMPLEKWKEFFNKYDGDALARGWRIGEEYAANLDKIAFSKLLKLNIKLFIKYPVEYLDSYFDITNILWEMGTPNDGSVYYFTPLSEAGWYDGSYNKYGIVSKTTIFTPVTEAISNLFLRTKIFNQIQVRGGFSLYLLLLSAIILTYKKRKKEIIAILPLLIYCATLFISIPASYSRYIFQFVPSAIFFIIYAIFVQSHRSNEQHRINKKF